MKKSKLTISTLLIDVLLLGVMNLLVFLIFKNRTNVFWASYAFMTGAFFVRLISMLLTFRKADKKTVFFGIPLAIFAVFYLGAALTTGFLFMIFQKAGFTLCVVVQTLVLVSFLIVSIVALLSSDYMQNTDASTKQNIVGHKSLLISVESLAAACTQSELKAALLHLADTIRYSDPMSTAAVAGVEQRIVQKLGELQFCTNNDQTPAALAACKDLEILYLERNKLLALSK